MNIFTSFLSLLKVKHTKYFSTKLYNEHSYKYTLYGLSCMLEEYKIQTMGLQIDDKDELQLLETPFIAQVSNDFVLVTDLHRQTIKYIWREKKITTTIEKFKNLWSGVVLLAESKADSIEPNYSQNLKQELFSRIEKYIQLILILFVSCGAFINSFDFSLWQRIFLIITSSTGLYVCYLLLLKQLRINSSSADKICSLFNKSDCNDVLESPAARLMGVVGWSEVGFSYFLGNLLILLFFYDFIYYLTIINIVVP